MLSPSGFAYCSASRLQELSKTGRGRDPRPITKSSATLDEKRAYKLMSHLDARMQHGYTGHVPKRAGDEAQQEDLLNASCTKTGVLGYKGYRVGQRERTLVHIVRSRACSAWPLVGGRGRSAASASYSSAARQCRDRGARDLFSVEV